MKYLLTGSFLFLIILSSCGQEKKDKYQSAIKAAKDSVATFMKRKHVPGVSLTITINGKIVLSEGFGYADLEQKVPVNPAQTRFRIGSISKSLTAVALAKMFEQKKIILDSTVYFYIPDLPRYKYRPTVRQVAGHIAGVRHYKGDEWFSDTRYNSVADGLTMFKNDSLNFEPGTKYQYSSHGYNLLSAVLEKASGKDFLTLMKEDVFAPLKLTNTVADMNDSIISYRTRFYEFQNGRWVNARHVDNSYKWAGGGFISTSEDIARFGNVLLGETFLKKETISLFTAPQKLKNGSSTTYGMGFASGTDHHKRNNFGHSGGSVGGTTDMVIYPNEKIVVVIFANMSAVDLVGFSRDIAHLFMETTK
jgi:serine beta-lactamase-like protein LACTB, mitochondrial